MNKINKQYLIMTLIGLPLATLLFLGVNYYMYDRISVLFGFVLGIYVTLGMLLQIKDKEHFMN